ncbi:4-(cytidine 5'-diphospho)-2-C-methyl-D-erythritol kinase [Niastella yeongjuensis]|uniref:4-diphosphocytidyl-2-C-methyl-D-erythritol kinase n=1 Tax=Niastella yeongjuensis TaxID=354355 RepID=A0A1V9E9U4_9BACT|nr:4-(cytidine 5'-diphospho)-2-C-methyl-D-erythritol kinase [Niastella yeongjuensis]OQP42869.1 4-(cytidine 5'-diphospho)-2-C-methyl-D-erythritol kinase [Niastella yeongjuensis]SEO57423.1 4-diphosphocytidyl-2-C-methyl-D-erythritol kinase [Niastella yeongjuensis]
MIVFPNCKINLGLHVVRKREDGYHELETIFYPLPLKDALEVVRTEGKGQKAEIHLSGLPVQGRNEDNLCIKAYNLLKKDHPELAGVDLYLHKAIPMGAGLGGGSADGAFTLLALNDKFQLNISREKLLDYSLQLGSDCPFFIVNKTSYATGRGELLQSITLDLSAYSFLVVHPGVHINTGWAFSQLSPAPSPQSLTELIQQPVSSWRNTLTNDFEAPVCNYHPDLQAIKDALYDGGALYASMTGSGSCFYGIFPKDQLPAIQWPAHYLAFTIK